MQRLADQQTGKPLIDKDRAVAVVPVQRQQARLAGFELCGLFGQRNMRAVLFACRLEYN